MGHLCYMDGKEELSQSKLYSIRLEQNVIGAVHDPAVPQGT